MKIVTPNSSVSAKLQVFKKSKYKHETSYSDESEFDDVSEADVSHCLLTELETKRSFHSDARVEKDINVDSAPFPNSHSGSSARLRSLKCAVMLLLLTSIATLYTIKTELDFVRKERDQLVLQLRKVTGAYDELKIQISELQMTVMSISFERDKLQHRIEELDIRMKGPMDVLQTNYGIHFSGNVWDAVISFLNRLVSKPPWYLRWAIWWMFG